MEKCKKHTRNDKASMQRRIDSSNIEVSRSIIITIKLVSHTAHTNLFAPESKSYDTFPCNAKIFAPHSRTPMQMRILLE